MRAIVCRFLPATNHRPARVVADAGEGRRLTIGYHSENLPFRAAAIMLCERLNWYGELTPGTLPDGTPVFTLVDRSAPKIIVSPMVPDHA